MGSKAKSLKISHDLSEASVLRAKLMGHSSWAGYVKSLIRRDIGGVICKKMNLERLTLFEQDLLDRLLHHKVKTTKTPPPAE